MALEPWKLGPVAVFFNKCDVCTKILMYEAASRDISHYLKVPLHLAVLLTLHLTFSLGF